jgi:hypothetical protein
MLAPSPACSLNQTFADSGIPLDSARSETALDLGAGRVLFEVVTEAAAIFVNPRDNTARRYTLRF